MNTRLGKYQAFDTPIHKIDARIKLIALLIFMVSIFLPYGRSDIYMDYSNLLVYLGIFLILLFLTIFSKTSFLQLFRSLKALWIMVIFLIFINIFLPTKMGGDIAFTLWGKDIYYSTIFNLSYILVRLVLVMMMTNIFTSSTKPMEMTAALEWLLTPLKIVRIPVHKFAMAISLALRFIPTLIEETNRIMKAQASRGVDYKQGKFKDKMKAIISLIIPLFMTAFLTSGELADAMEARGYDPDSPRTRYRTYKWGIRDTVSCFAVLLFLTGIVLLCVFRFDIQDILPITDLPRLA